MKEGKGKRKTDKEMRKKEGKKRKKERKGKRRKKKAEKREGVGRSVSAPVAGRRTGGWAMVWWPVVRSGGG